jgi:hypothetical protein
MMNKLKWNKVTWYSKTIALAIFVVWPFVFFYLGAIWGAALQANRDNLQPQGIPIQRSTP